MFCFEEITLLRETVRLMPPASFDCNFQYICSSHKLCHVCAFIRRCTNIDVLDRTALSLWHYVEKTYWNASYYVMLLILTWTCGEGTNGVQRRFSGFACTKPFCLVRLHNKWSCNSLRFSIITHLNQTRHWLPQITWKTTNNVENVNQSTMHNQTVTTFTK